MITRIAEQRGRLVQAVLVGLIVLLLVLPLALAGRNRSATIARAETRAVADGRIAQAYVASQTEEVEQPGNVWLVNTEDEWFDPRGDTWTDPPLFSLAAVAGLDPNQQEYDFDGKWLAVAQWVGGSNVIVTVVERDDQDAAIAASTWRWGWAALAVSLAAGWLAWVGLGRMNGPVVRAHAVNRDFIADAAHELRTPLAIIQASAGHALARERPPEAYRESLGEILLATERAGASVGELLEFARLEAGQATLRFAPLRLDLLVEEVASSIRIDGVTVEPVIGEAVVVEADFALLRQVIDNITRNAAARASKVTLTTILDTREARVEIADDGPGFDPGVLDHVFERFRRGDQSGSVGLGMAIARTVIDMHGGRCEARNLPAGADGDPAGALVTVAIPYKQ